MSSGDAAAALRDEKDDPQFSVWWGGSADGYVAAQADGLLEAYISPNAAAVPPQSKDAEGYWTGIYIGALGFCSNSEVLATVRSATNENKTRAIHSAGMVILVVKIPAAYFRRASVRLQLRNQLKMFTTVITQRV